MAFLYGAVSISLTSIFYFLELVMLYGVFSQHVCKCIMCLPGAYGVQKRTSDPQRLELQPVVSHHVCAGN